MAIAANNAPDVCLFDQFMISSFAARKGLTDLTPYIAASGLVSEDFFAATWDEAVFEGRIWGVPHNTDARALFYRVDHFEEAGLDPDKPPRTWKELEQYAERLTIQDAHGRFIRIGFVPTWGDSHIYLYGWLNGGRFMDEEGEKVTCNEPEIVEAMQWMVRFSDRYGVSGLSAFGPDISRSGTREVDPFILGKLSMKIDGSWQIPALKETASRPVFTEDEKLKPFMQLLQKGTKYRPVTPVARYYRKQLVEATKECLLHVKEPQAALDEVAVKVQKELENFRRGLNESSASSENP